MQNGLSSPMTPFKFDNGGILDEQLHLDSAKMILTKSVIRPLVMSKLDYNPKFENNRVNYFRFESVSGTGWSKTGWKDNVPFRSTLTWDYRAWHFHGNAPIILL